MQIGRWASAQHHPTPPRTRPGPPSYNGQQATTSDTKEISLPFPSSPAPPFPFLPLPLPLSLGARRDRAEEPYRPPSPKAAAEAGAQLRGRLEVRGCVWNRRWAREIRPAGMQQDQRNKVWPPLLLSSCLLVNFAVSLPTIQKHTDRQLLRAASVGASFRFRFRAAAAASA